MDKFYYVRLLLYIFAYVPKLLADPYDPHGIPADMGVPKYVPSDWNMHERGGFVKTKLSHGSSYTYPPVMETYKEDCPPLEGIYNAQLTCMLHAGCKATCIDDHQFPNGATTLVFKCESGGWKVKGMEWDSLPSCEPICLPVCQNNGMCIAPGQCDCPANFNGPQCQYERKPCLNQPPLPKNSRRSCTTSSCTITCAKGHQFPDGSTATNVVCKEGNWVPSREDMTMVPNCQPTCYPSCENGGICLSLNVCQCPKEFRGPQCQYSADSCVASNLGFNGGYNCSGDGDSISCSLNCPAGIDFEFPPVFKYTCTYATGVFQPQPLPQCVFGKHTVIDVEGGGHDSYKSSIHSNALDGSFEGMDRHHGGGGMYTKNSKDAFLKSEKLMESKHRGMYHGMEETNVVDTSGPKSGICFTWGGAHFKTFDGKVYSFYSECEYVLVRDSQDNTFSVTVQNVKGGRRIKIFTLNKEYTLEPSEDGEVIFRSAKRLLPIPAQLAGFRVEMSGHLIQIDLETIGVVIKWNRVKFVQVDVSQSMWNRTAGLCGRIDGNPENDIATREGTVPKTITALANSWQIKKVGGDVCNKRPSEQHACSTQKPEVVSKAAQFCGQLVAKKRFSACSKVMDISLLFESCKWDYCGCIHRPRESCGCDSLAVYANQCVSQGVATLKNWRDENTCKMECPAGMVYQWCGPMIQKSCGSATFTTDETTHSGGAESSCTEGCFCPRGTLFHRGKCVTSDQCPCRLRGKEFPPGSNVPKDCNTCNCQNGEWKCTQASCGSRCSAIGDPHYQTFDGKRYNFMGQCSYVLVKGDDYCVEAENVACAGAISEAMNLPKAASELPSCTKALTIRLNESVIQLKQGKAVIINGKDVNKLPIRYYGMKISVVSSMFMRVELPNGLELWWDGMTRVHIDAPASFQGKTQGLCGTFNNNQKDDFLTPEGDVEQAIIPFANKWKTMERCDDLQTKDISNPCEVNVYNKPTAEALCGKLKSQLFEECHWRVDVEPFYEDCLYDMCSCDGPVDKCLCPIIGAYATECARQSVFIQWRYNVKECEVHCPGGQTYQVCGDSCKRSCYDIAGVYEDLTKQSEESRCRSQCVEGCNCPEGETLDESGDCIPIGRCSCRHAGLEFPPQYKEVRPGIKQKEFCTCIGARWECRPATDEEAIKYPRALDIKDKCSPANHEEFTTCEAIQPLTCKNMHKNAEVTSIDCHPGCQCVKGYVLDAVTKKCIKPEDCPCHHGGKSYSEGEKMQEDCNTCQCNGGKWSCEKRPCPGVCSTWGDSHFRTYDGRNYDFQGVCTYLLSKGSLDFQKDTFSIEIQNEVCGTSGVTCSKAVTLKVGGLSPEIVTFTKDKPIPDVRHLERIKIRNAGLFVFADVPSLGIVMQWDKGTRVYVKINPSWKGKLKGLCGNYNDNEEDDFQTPSGGITETSARLFGDSWKLKPHCSQSQEFQDTCALHPERQTWAAQQCGILKRAPFTLCHSEVPPTEFLQRCERDTCACGLGGDCECLCTALAAYAHECAARGVPIKWRSQQMCPIQCDETCTNYSPCISTCPEETCDNTLTYAAETTMCHQDTCIEGCVKKKSCSPNEVYSNDTLTDCMPRASCKPICLTLPNGETLYEGDVVDQDDCHTCHCSRGSKVCRGQPCFPTTEAPTGMMEETVKCKTGWTDWINNETPGIKKVDSSLKTKTSKPYSVEIEALPTFLQMNNMLGAVCTHDKIVDIECRTATDKKSSKETGLEAECSVEKGLFCRQPSAVPCPDFEIRVKCQCDEDKSKILDAGSMLLCDVSLPYSEFPSNCSKYYECSPGLGTYEYPNMIVRSCDEDMLYNPKTMKCDWADNVLRFKPSCKDVLTTVVYEFTTSKYHIDTPVTVSPTFYKELKCDAARPNQEHPTDCASFFQCAPGMGPLEHPDLVLKTCGPSMLYNPKTMTCDWPHTVIAMKPHCSSTTKKLASHPTIGSTIEFVPKNESGETICEVGKVWDDCAVDCNKVCMFYDYYLKQKGKCKPGQKCEPGCIDKVVAGTYCGEGYFWRDANTCITLHDCTCRSHTGKPVKPGAVFKESECEICQCLQNQYTCDKSACASATKLPLLEAPKGRSMIAKYKKYFKNVDVTTESSAYDGSEDTLEENRMLGKSVTASPPPECDPDKYTNVLWEDELPMGDQAFTASSSLGPSFLPQYAKLNGKATEKSGGSWTPEESNPYQYIQVKLKRIEPIYGVLLQGSPLFDQYVTSYKVKYSKDGINFNFVKTAAGSPQVFRGPIDHVKPMKQMFDVPIEAKYVSIVPLTWHDTIAVRFELIGCSKVATTTSRPTTAVTTAVFGELSPMDIGGAFDKCKESMGIGEGLLPERFVKVSSFDPNYPPIFIGIKEDRGWQSVTNSPREWIEIDFTALRNLTGIQTKGGPNGWVTSYIVKYSPDHVQWNTIMNEGGEQKVFAANYDKTSPVTNIFKRPIQAQFLKIMPIKWSGNINMRIEPYGCFVPYDEEVLEEFLVGPEAEMPEDCEICTGVSVPIDGCDCIAPMAYDGHKCELRVKCPCIVGHMPYAVGSTYETEDCSVCTCKLGGTPDCAKKICPPCATGLIRSTNAICDCECVPCPAGTKICPTSDNCVPEALWCNGIEDCPDDELDCVVPTESSPTDVEELEKVCPNPKCPTGYKIVEKKPDYTKLELMDDDIDADSLFAVKKSRKSYMRYYKGGAGVKGGAFASKGGTKSSQPFNTSMPLTKNKLTLPTKAIGGKQKDCIQWRCVSARPAPKWNPFTKKSEVLPPCPAPYCPDKYILKQYVEQLDEQDCPKYDCIPPPRRDVVCNVTSRTFNTFDGIEYQYDICNHVLARDANLNLWDVSVQKNCTHFVCVNELLISTGTDKVKFNTDLTVEFNGYKYTVDQTTKIGLKTQTFVISKLGNTLFFVSTEYGFWVIYDNKGNVKIGIVGKLFGQVDGLCGFYNAKQEDDRRKPDGTQALSTEEFGDSWANKGSLEKCKTHTCPVELQNKAWEICEAVASNKGFSECSALYFEKNRGRCLEDVCQCLQSAESTKVKYVKIKVARTKEEHCKCQALQTSVTDCLAADQSINLQGWRTEMNCPANCPAPFVHQDCFRQSCELSCDNIKEDRPCPVTSGVCFSGCFCPEGYVRKGENCVLPTECRDCVCDGLGRPHIVTFDKNNFTFDGKCAYTVVRDKPIRGKHTFEIYVNYGMCPDNKDSVCTQSFRVLYKSHVIQIEKDVHALKSTVDGMSIHHYPYINDWGKLRMISEKDITLVIGAIQLELSALFHNMAFTVKVPSMLFGEKLEGLCGNCNGDDNSEVSLSEGPLAYAKHWRAPTPILEVMDIEEKTCVEKPKDHCWPLPPEKDPCLKLLDESKFGRCHLVVDPGSYVSTCQEDICSSSKDVNVCSNLEAYVRECARHGLCLDWRADDYCPYKCDGDLEYDACGIGCQLTCLNYEKYTEKPSLCSGSLTEGCFCPKGKIFVNDTCIDANKCHPCDSEGHYVGDSWQLDECNECSCTINGTKCIERSCAKGISCTTGSEPKQLTKPAGQCCPDFICVPITDIPPTCEEPSQIICAPGQVMKLETMANHCPQFICQCKPLEECDLIDPKSDFEVLEPGFEKIINTSGCCPQLEYVCKLENCPDEKECPKHYLLKHTKGKNDCCPKYTCEVPPHKCIHELEYESGKLGGEIKRTSDKKPTVLKSIGETWNDGPCRNCECKEETDGDTRSICSLTKCPVISSTEDFKIESIGVPSVCCSEAKYVGCKYNGKIYKVNETWNSDTNPCESYKCKLKAGDEGILEKQVTVNECKQTCKLGSKYVPSKNPKKCCGDCVQTACVVGGKVYPIGEKWTSTDYCMNSICVEKDGDIHVEVTNASCPLISASLKKDFKYTEVVEKGKCCKKVTQIACLDDLEVREEGAKWKSRDDPCKLFICNRETSGELVKKATTDSCQTKCPIGWKYKPSVDPLVCCGKCSQIACIADDEMYSPGQKWMSPDNCTTYSCDVLSDQFMVSGSQESCPDVSECKPENIYLKGCCKHCNITSLPQVSCLSEKVAPEKTVGIVQQWKGPHGKCINMQPINNFKECQGSCNSGTVYNQERSSHDSNCNCCQAAKYDGVVVDMTCEDNFKFKKQIPMPSYCECLPCVSEALGTKTGYRKV